MSCRLIFARNPRESRDFIISFIPSFFFFLGNLQPVILLSFAYMLSPSPPALALAPLDGDAVTIPPAHLPPAVSRINIEPLSHFVCTRRCRVTFLLLIAWTRILSTPTHTHAHARVCCFRSSCVVTQVGSLLCLPAGVHADYKWVEITRAGK